MSKTSSLENNSNLKSFTKKEIGTTLILLIVISVFLILNLKVSLRRSRDAQRQADINAISDALGKYQKDFGFFPPSTGDGKILGCKNDNFGPIPDVIKESEKKDYFFNMLKGCEWGKDSLSDVNDSGYESYLKTIPVDPKGSQGYSYLYISDTYLFQLYAYLEGEDGENEYRRGIVDRGLKCGINECNFGKAYGETPLEISLQEYENEINSGKK